MTALTLAEIDALPVDAEITDNDGDVWRKIRVERWQLLAAQTHETAQVASFVHAHYSPIRLESAPPVAAEWPLHMTKCAHDGCTTAHALPPGSSWLCADHNKNLTTRGTR